MDVQAVLFSFLMEKDIFRNIIETDDLKCQLVKFTQIDEEVPMLPGIYSWYIRSANNEYKELEKFYNAYVSRSYEATITGNFDFIFGGSIESKSKTSFLKKDSSKQVDSELLIATSLLFTPPIYIGISKKNLNKRLNDHVSHYKKYYQKKELSVITQPEISDDDLDRPNESNYFGYRLAKLIKERGLSTNNLFVKVISYKKKFTNEDQEIKEKKLLTLEKILNKTIKPILGKK